MIIIAILGIILIIAILADAFETIILPRRVNRRIRLSRLFYRVLWQLWLKEKKLFKSADTIKTYLGVFGPLSLIILISIWAFVLIIGFAFLNYGIQTDIQSPQNAKDFITYLYLSGATFFPVGLPDTFPAQPFGKFIAIIESGIGFAFLAMVIGYLPVLYQGFSRREVNINLLDSHAGSPPNAPYLLQQLTNGDSVEILKAQLANWEQWCAELLETHLSYPVLAYYRSQHDNQSWVAALTMILDASTLILISKNRELHNSAKATFAIARHAAVDLTEAFYLTPHPSHQDRLSKKDLIKLRAMLSHSAFALKEGEKPEEKLLFMRKLYEPYMHALSDFFVMHISPIVSDEKIEEAWRKNI